MMIGPEKIKLLDAIEGLTLRDCIDYFRAKTVAAQLPREREIDFRIKRFLYDRSEDFVIGTQELMRELFPGIEDQSGLARRALKIAKKHPGLATHDGEVFEAYGRTNRRWRWHGQRESEEW